ncbi:MAG TPA: hypothetical protein VGJ73_05200 [Verrucomicrobiae bacterium]|jgi:uncharacterized membrane protein YagU involved in acid resistance
MTTSFSLVEIIFCAGAICGTIDFAAAMAFSASRGVPPQRALRAIASAAIGPGAFERSGAAALGLALHFVIAFSVAAVYVCASRWLPALNQYPVTSGILYGICVHLVMTFIVLPLSALKRPFSMTFFLGQLLIHAFCVGLPIALVTHYFYLHSSTP